MTQFAIPLFLVQQRVYRGSSFFAPFPLRTIRGYVIGHAEHGRSMDMGGAMHAPRCMLRASILLVGGCRDAEHARRARSKSSTVTETRMGRLKYGIEKEGEEQLWEDDGKQRGGFRTQ